MAFIMSVGMELAASRTVAQLSSAKQNANRVTLRANFRNSNQGKSLRCRAAVATEEHISASEEGLSDEKKALYAGEHGDLYREFDRLLETQDFNFKVGDKVVGTVFKVDNKGAFVDVGAKSSCFLPLVEAAIVRPPKLEEMLQPGDQKEFAIIRENDYDGSLTLSLRRIEYEQAWAEAREIMAKDEEVQGDVLELNKGGLVVTVGGLRGFVPLSHVSPLLGPREELPGQTIPLKFLEVDEERTRLVLSNRRAQGDGREALKVGDVVEGVVQTVKPYGVFVDIGGNSGLLHISQISHDRISNVEEVLAVGDKLKVMVLSQDKEKGRISLSTKKLEPTPGDMLRNPALVFEKADEMAATFKERIAAAEAAARAEEERLQGDQEAEPNAAAEKA
mmetsp:Transcript_9623/g.35260  ORF Transcript_9623/g.35260 Transcript_9623/m.35260 type:complete len:391 (-) Transcript_9623:224-1396(-)|eukprot:scaffold503_cov365-Prasinococcus_capsulatus_cf.AAC.17